MNTGWGAAAVRDPGTAAAPKPRAPGAHGDLWACQGAKRVDEAAEDAAGDRGASRLGCP